MASLNDEKFAIQNLERLRDPAAFQKRSDEQEVFKKYLLADIPIVERKWIPYGTLSEFPK